VTALLGPARRSGSGRQVLLLALAMLLAAGFVGLGIWQFERLAWKLDLIARVEARVSAPATAPPGPDAWAEVNAEADEYRHVSAAGHFLNDREALVQAVTEQGPGYWVVTPFVADSGFTILINRGFVPSDRRERSTRLAGNIEGHATVKGLLRLSEPGGGFLHANDPAHGRWYSRDVAAIAKEDGLDKAAPYFIDADATPNAGGLPLGGLTVTHFPNPHLAYALTWFALAALLVAAVGYIAWRSRRQPF